MNSYNKALLISITILSLLILLFPARAEIDLMSFEANIFDSNGDPVNGNISIEIYDAATAGDLIYNSSDDFIGNTIFKMLKEVKNE